MSRSVVAGKEILKEFIIETKNKNKKLSIYHGNILDDPCEMIGISMYDADEAKGDLYKDHHEQNFIGYDLTPERTLLAFNEEVWTGVANTLDNKRHILYIHFKGKEGDIIQQESLHAIIKMTFASLASYIYEGAKITSVSLPILFRKGINSIDYRQYIHQYISESANFLRKNTTIVSINLYIWHAEDADDWLDVLNKSLQPSINREVTNENITSLKQGIEAKLRQPFFIDLLPEWIRKKALLLLSKRDLDHKQFVFTADKIVNFVLDTWCNDSSMPAELKNLNPFKKIIIIKSQRLIVEWLADYFLSLKIYKNYINDQSFNAEEEYLFLIQLYQVLDEAERLLQRGGNIE